MSLSKTDLNLFVVFDAIYSEGNLTRAGQILGITQPAVSNALARLRNLFDDQLFIRTAQGMKPTPAAQNIIVQVRQALHMLRHSIQESNHFQPKISEKVFCFSMGDLEESTILPRLFRSLATEAPRVSIESYQVRKQHIAGELESGVIDFAIDAPMLNDPHLKHAPLIEEPFVCFVRRDHPVAKTPLTLDTYLGMSHIQLSSNRHNTGPVDQALNRLGLQRRIALKAQHYLMAPVVVAKSDFALTVPRSLALEFPDLIALDLPFDVENFSLHLYWHEAADRDPANIWMRDLVMRLTREQIESVVAA
mgnify:CR=1 FL=1